MSKEPEIGWRKEIVEGSGDTGNSEKRNRNRKDSTSSSSSYSSSSSSSVGDGKVEKTSDREKRRQERKERRRLRKEMKRERKELKRAAKKESKEAYKEMKRQKKEEKKKYKRMKNDNSERKSQSESDDCGVPIDLMTSNIRVPQTKEQWEAKQNQIKRVKDPETGRIRLIKGDGEVLEEIVSRKQHLDINKKATEGDGAYFQSQLKRI